jgi:hypothetical protein
MADTELVDVDVAEGRALVQALDKAGVRIVGAYWYYYPDSDRWRLTIVSPDAVKGSRSLYMQAIELRPDIDLSKVEFVSPDNAIYRALVGGRLFAVKGLGQVRVSKSSFNGVYVDDAIIYRLD